MLRFVDPLRSSTWSELAETRATQCIRHFPKRCQTFVKCLLYAWSKLRENQLKLEKDIHPLKPLTTVGSHNFPINSGCSKRRHTGEELFLHHSEVMSQNVPVTGRQHDLEFVTLQDLRGRQRAQREMR